MKNTQRKLPGIGFRILSFIPVLNWISLLYIGLINSSALNVICAVAYAVITFTDTSLSPLIWLLGILHYAIAYRNVKKQIIGDMGKSTTQTRINPIYKSASVSNGVTDIVVSNEQEYKRSIPEKPSYASEGVKVSVSPKNTSVSNGVTDIVVPGEQEYKQSIPVKPSYASESVKVSISIENTSNTKFFIDMKKNASREGKTAAFVPFMAYWPTYDSMNGAQQAWYFYWRSQIRQGNYLDTDLSYIFVLIYELLSGIGWQDPQEGYQKLMQLWAAYRKKFPSLDSYLTRWTFDFTQQYNLEYRLS
ncbi:MAG: TerB protein, partial [Euryarchaeota archaeon]|nr:TerB protein [Euryarchaeota archaeon]